MSARHPGEITAPLPSVLGKHIGPTVLAKLEELDSPGRIVAPLFVVDCVVQEHAHNPDDHVGHAGCLAARITPLLDVPALKERYRLEPMGLSQWLNDEPVHLLHARPLRTELRRDEIVIGESPEGSSGSLPRT